MAKYSPKGFFHHFWTRESGLTSMFVLLFLHNFILIPLFRYNHAIRISTNIFWLLFLYAGIVTLAKNRTHAWLLSVIPAVFIVVHWFEGFHDHHLLRYTDFILSILIFILLISLVLVKVFEKGPMTIHRIVGAVVVFMLIGNFFAVMYQFIYMEVPGSFILSIQDPDRNTIQSTFIYFSFTSLTTTGYGDILPLRPFVRNLVVIEQLIGVLYPVVLIGKLVSFQIVLKGSRRKPHNQE